MRRMRSGLYAVLSALLATACSNTNLPSFTSATTGPGVTLSKAQLAATHEGVRRMISNPDSAKFLGDVARREGNEPGNVIFIQHAHRHGLWTV